MPGLRGNQFDIDTSDWAVQDWRLARIWNIAFFVTWCAFFVYALVSQFDDRNWLLFLPTLVIEVVGYLLTLGWLLRVSNWLKEDRSPLSLDAPE